MIVRANKGFAGAFSMHKGQVKECNDTVILQDLLSCGYIEEVKQETVETELKDVLPVEKPIAEPTTMEGGTKNESKRSKRK